MNAESTIYQVGFSSTDISPPVGIKLAGLGARTGPSDGVYHPLRAVCVALGDGTTNVIIVSVEWVGCYERTPVLREGIGRSTGLTPDKILLNATHTHCGPTVRGREAIDEAYHGSVLEKVGRCARAAWEARAPARLRVTGGVCGIAVSRRWPDSRGKVTGPQKPAPEGPHDHEVPVVCVEAEDGTLTGLLFSYACHPTGRGGYFIGGDYVAYACDALERAFPGATACFLQGCVGDQKLYSDDPDGFPYLELENLEAKGRQLGEAAAKAAMEGASQPVTGALVCRSHTLELSTERVEPRVVKQFLDVPEKRLRDWAEYFLDTEAWCKDPRDRVEVEIQTLRFGRSLAIVGLAAEPTVEHGLRMKRELGQIYGSVFPLGYCNDMIGYIPVKRQIEEGGCEVWRGNQLKLRSGPYVAETEERLHQAIREQLAEE